MRASKPAPRKPTRRGGRGKRYSDAERNRILETAKREGLTGAQVRRRFGVSTLTFYLWRKKTKTVARRPPVQSSGHEVNGKVLERELREAIRVKLRELLPQLIKRELENAFR